MTMDTRNSAFLLAVIALFLNADAKAQSIDPSFGMDGKVPYGGPLSNSEQNRGKGYNSVVQPDGKVLVSMDLSNGNISDLWFYTYRFNPDGSPDLSFGNNGVSRLFAGDQSMNYDLQLEPDGRIVVVGQTEYCVNGICGAPQFIMMRLLSDGALDTSFGSNGHVITTDVFGIAGTFAYPNRVRRAPNGKYTVGGRGINGQPFVARLNANGFPDQGYATAGVFTIPVQYGEFIDLAVDADQNCYALVKRYNYIGGVPDAANGSDSYIVKLGPTGVPDATFGTNGSFALNLFAEDEPSSITLAPDNGILVTGSNWIGFVTAVGTLSSVVPGGVRVLQIPAEGVMQLDKLVILGPDRSMICGKVQQEVAGNFQEKAFVGQVDAQGLFRTDFNSTGYMVMDHGAVGSTGWNGKLCRLLDLDVLPDGTAYATGYRNPIAGNTTSSLYLIKFTGLPMEGTFLSVPAAMIGEASYVYPNPTTELVQVNMAEAATFELCDARGAAVQSGRFHQGLNTLVFDAGIRSGLYALTLRTIHGQALPAMRIVKQ